MQVEKETRASAAKPDPFVGRTFDGYRIESVIGRGGMGVVYLATQLSLDRPVAIKVLPEDFATHPQFLERFHREVDILSRLSHPNVVTVFERGAVDGREYLVMEYVRGTSLREVIRNGPLPPAEALSIVRSVLAGLEHAHLAGIVHRDIKPENVLLAPGGIVKVADFGLSRIRGPEDMTRLTHTHLLLGTFEYMAPEQREKAKEADERSDLYATGVVLYEMIAGELPIGMFAPLSEKRPGECDRRLDEVIRKCLDKQPERRYQHASEMGEEVSRILSRAAVAADEPEAPAAPALSARAERHARRRMEMEEAMKSVANPWSAAGIICGLWMALMIGVLGWNLAPRTWMVLGTSCAVVYWIFVLFGHKKKWMAGAVWTVILSLGVGILHLQQGPGGPPAWLGSPDATEMDAFGEVYYANVPLGSLNGTVAVDFPMRALDDEVRGWLPQVTHLPFPLGPEQVTLWAVSGRLVCVVHAGLAAGAEVEEIEIQRLAGAIAEAVAVRHPEAFQEELDAPWKEDSEFLSLLRKLPPPGPDGQWNVVVATYTGIDDAAAKADAERLLDEGSAQRYVRTNCGHPTFPAGVQIEASGGTLYATVQKRVCPKNEDARTVGGGLGRLLEHRRPQAYKASTAGIFLPGLGLEEDR